jgi:polyribonucleotide nucleotidyltransferase
VKDEGDGRPVRPRGAPKFDKQKIGEVFNDLQAKVVRWNILDTGVRIDGRDVRTVRPILSQVGVLPRTHGSALFTRGETQALVVATLAPAEDEQIVDSLEGTYRERFMLHYNFPPSTASARPAAWARPAAARSATASSPGAPFVPCCRSQAEFPYTIRVVSEITESNGSSSMATVCGASLSLMDAGVPLKRPTPASPWVLSRKAIATPSSPTSSATRITSATWTSRWLAPITASRRCRWTSRSRASPRRSCASPLAGQGRPDAHPRSRWRRLSPAPAPSSESLRRASSTMKIPTDKIREVIGTGGKVIREIVEKTGAKIDIEDDGTVKIASV